MRFLPSLVGLVLVTLLTLAHGILTDRWSTPNELKDAPARAEHTAMTVGDWRGETTDPDPASVTPGTECLTRRYTNLQNGSVVTMTLVWGRPGPVSVHTPQVCYQGAGYAMASQQHQRGIRSADFTRRAEFWMADFSKAGQVNPSPVRVLWAWNDGGDWQAPENPRLVFAHQSLLYKLYVVRPLAALNEPLEDEPALSFLRVLLPEMDRTLFAVDYSPSKFYLLTDSRNRNSCSRADLH